MADKEWQKRLNDSGYKNWLKVSLALIESKEALHDFVEDVIKNVHNRIKTKLGSGVCTGTSACNTNKGAPSCPSCSQWVKEIKAISGGMLNWKNTDPHNWHNKPWEIAKCFMNPQGSKATAAANTGPDKTDLSGILNVLVNCKEFKSHLKEKKLPEHVRTVRNELMHCATMSFDDAEMQTKVDTVIALLEDENELENLPICQEKVKRIKSLRDTKFQLKPEDEDVCIDAALKTPGLSVEAGEEIDEGTRRLLDNLCKLIKENKDLEKKFDVKFNKIDKKLKNLKEETDARFSSYDIIIGNLSGKVESLESRVQKLESETSGSSSSSVLAQHEKSLFKNALQSYTQKKKLEFPKYEHTKDMDGMYLGTVLVQGQKFKSKEPKATKRGAEQSAAEVALTFLGNMDSEDNDLNNSPSTVHHPMASKCIPQQSKSFKNMLQERAQIQRIPNPIYDAEQVESGFLCKVMYDGRWYSPEITPQSRKIDAQQKAAQFVLAVLDREEESNCKNEGSSSDAETSVQGGSTITTSNRSLLAVDKTDGKTSKSLLHEYAQKRGAKPPEYDEIPGSEKGFRSMVKIMDKTFKCVEPCSSKKNSREMAAKEAMKYFNELSTENSSKTSTDISAAAALDCGKIESENASSLAEVKENLIDCEVPSSTSLPISSVTNKAYVFTSATSNEKSLAEAVKPSETKVTDSTDEKQTPTLTQKTQPNSKNALQEYVQKRKLEELRYVSTQDPTTKEFLSKVFLGKRCFKGKLRKSKAKEAEKHVAEIALNILEGRSGTADGNCKELLKSYHKELDLPMFPKFEDDTCKDDGRFSVCVKVLKKYKIVCDDVQPNKKKAETWLAEQAVKVLEEEKRMIADPAHENAKSVLNRFLQSQGNISTLKYEVQGDQNAGFSGCLYFCAIDVYECLAPQPSKEEAVTSAAMSACNGLDLI